VQARKFDLAFVALDGEIGCMVNGAGLAMATMDIIHHYGGKPANFLDVGGGASEEKVAEGFKILLSDPHVKAILVNIFGGIMNCETLAKGIVAAANQLQLKVPLIVRMEGTNVEQGKKILADSKLNIQIANGLDEAARMACQNRVKN
jgi:succinyl-CoA synthetase beta subunit